MRKQIYLDNKGITDYSERNKDFSKTRVGFLYHSAFVFTKDKAGKFEFWLKEFVGDSFVVELGCGTGALSHFCKKYIGLDANVDGGNDCNQDFFAVDLSAPYEFDPPVEADVLLSFDFFEHIEEDKIFDVLYYANKLLKPGAKIFFSIDTRGDIPGHVTIKDPAWWEAKFYQIGWIKDTITQEFENNFFENIPEHWGALPWVKDEQMIFLFHKEGDL